MQRVITPNEPCIIWLPWNPSCLGRLSWLWKGHEKKHAGWKFRWDSGQDIVSRQYSAKRSASPTILLPCAISPKISSLTAHFVLEVNKPCTVFSIRHRTWRNYSLRTNGHLIVRRNLSFAKHSSVSSFVKSHRYIGVQKGDKMGATGSRIFERQVEIQFLLAIALTWAFSFVRIRKPILTSVDTRSFWTTCISQRWPMPTLSKELNIKPKDFKRKTNFNVLTPGSSTSFVLWYGTHVQTIFLFVSRRVWLVRSAEVQFTLCNDNRYFMGCTSVIEIQ